MGWPAVAGGVAAALTTLGIVCGALAWLVRTIVRQETSAVAAQVATSNGATLAEVTEKSAKTVTTAAAEIAKARDDLGSLQQEISMLSQWVDRNRDSAQEASTVAAAAQAAAATAAAQASEAIRLAEQALERVATLEARVDGRLRVER